MHSSDNFENSALKYESNPEMQRYGMKLNKKKNEEKKIIFKAPIMDQLRFSGDKMSMVTFLLPGSQPWTSIYEKGSVFSSFQIPKEIDELIEVNENVISRLTFDCVKKISNEDAFIVDELDINKGILPEGVALVASSLMSENVQLMDLIPAYGPITNEKIIEVVTRSPELSITDADAQISPVVYLYAELLNRIFSLAKVSSINLIPGASVCNFELIGAEKLLGLDSMYSEFYSALYSTASSDKILYSNKSRNVKKIPFISLTSEISYPIPQKDCPEKSDSKDSEHSDFPKENDEDANDFFIPQTESSLTYVSGCGGYSKHSVGSLATENGIFSIFFEIDFVYSVYSDVTILSNFDYPSLVKLEETSYGECEGLALLQPKLLDVDFDSFNNL